MTDHHEPDDRQRRQRRRRGWEFQFFGGTPETEFQSERHTEMSPEAIAADSFPLATARVGDRLRIVGLRGKGGTGRLLSMGLTPGTEFQVVSCAPSGSVVVALQDSRLGLGAGMAQKILVTDSSQESKPMKAIAHLQDLAVGSRGRVVGYEQTARAYKGKLLSMGLTPGTEFTVTRHAPLGDPVEIQVRGFNLSLRKAEADALRVEEVKEDE